MRSEICVYKNHASFTLTTRLIHSSVCSKKVLAGQVMHPQSELLLSTRGDLRLHSSTSRRRLDRPYCTVAEFWNIG